MPHPAPPRKPALPLLVGTALTCAALALLLRAGGADEAVFRALNGWAARALPGEIPAMLTLLGHGLVAVVLVSPWLRRAPAVPLAAVFSVPAGALFSQLGKALAATPRPAAVLDPSGFTIHGQVLAGHNSFPSGHSITAFTIVAVLLLCAPGVRTRVLPALAVVAAGAAVAASRVFVGAHWPSDTLGGAALGCLAGASGAWAATRWPLWQRRHGPSALALVALACSVALWFFDTGYPEALWLQRVLSVAGATLSMITLALPARNAA